MIGPREGFLHRTNQLWKYRLAHGWTTWIGLGLAGAGAWHQRSKPTLAGVMIILGLGLSVAGQVWAVLAIRCPECGARTLWRGLREQGLHSFESWLLMLQECPGCGADGADHLRRQPPPNTRP